MNHLLIAMSTTSMLSTLMCIVTVIIVLSLRLYKHFVHRLALYQVLASMFVSIAQCLLLLVINYNNSTFHIVSCQVTALLFQYTLWVKLLFTLCLVFHLFCLAVCLKNFKKLELVYILLSVLFPLLHVWIPFIHNSYGIAGAVCWIRDWNDNCPTNKYEEGTIEQFVLWFGPLFVSLTVCVVAVGIVLSVLGWRACIMNQKLLETETEPLLIRQEQNRNKTALKELLPLLAYPIIFFVLALFPLIDRIYDAISSQGFYLLVLAHLITIASWGFFSGLALLVHILLLRIPTRQRNYTHTISTGMKETVTVEYTTYTETSTIAKTKYSILAESDIDC